MKQNYNNKYLQNTSIRFDNVWVRIRFIAFMLKSKYLLDYTNLFSPNDYEKNDEVILKYFH